MDNNLQEQMDQCSSEINVYEMGLTTDLILVIRKNIHIAVDKNTMMDNSEYFHDMFAECSDTGTEIDLGQIVADPNIFLDLGRNKIEQEYGLNIIFCKIYCINTKRHNKWKNY